MEIIFCPMVSGREIYFHSALKYVMLLFGLISNLTEKDLHRENIRALTPPGNPTNKTVDTDQTKALVTAQCTLMIQAQIW